MDGNNENPFTSLQHVQVHGFKLSGCMATLATSGVADAASSRAIHNLTGSRGVASAEQGNAHRANERARWKNTNSLVCLLPKMDGWLNVCVQA